MPLTKSVTDSGFMPKKERKYGDDYHQGGQQGRPVVHESVNTPANLTANKEATKNAETSK